MMRVKINPDAIFIGHHRVETSFYRFLNDSHIQEEVLNSIPKNRRLQIWLSPALCKERSHRYFFISIKRFECDPSLSSHLYSLLRCYHEWDVELYCGRQRLLTPFYTQKKNKTQWISYPAFVLLCFCITQWANSICSTNKEAQRSLQFMGETIENRIDAAVKTRSRSWKNMEKSLSIMEAFSKEDFNFQTLRFEPDSLSIQGVIPVQKTERLANILHSFEKKFQASFQVSAEWFSENMLLCVVYCPYEHQPVSL